MVSWPNFGNRRGQQGRRQQTPAPNPQPGSQDRRQGLDRRIQVAGRFSFGLGALFGQVNSTMQKLQQSTQSLLNLLENQANPVAASIPYKFPNGKAAAATAFTYTFLDMGGPKAGIAWDLKRLSVSGPDPFTTLSGVSVIAFIDSIQYLDSNTEPSGFPNLGESPGAVPNSQVWSSHQLTLKYPEHLWLCFKGLANNQQVNANMQVEAYPETTRYMP